MEDRDLYAELVCALTHNIDVCTECGKCGKSGINARMNLIRRLAAYMGTELPWVEETNE